MANVELLEEPHYHWWKVCVDKSGKVTSCISVDKAEKPDGSVFFVSAVSRSDAEAQAEKLWSRKERDKTRVRRAANKAMGLCSCGRSRADSSVMCLGCLESAAKAKERAVLRARGQKIDNDRGESVRQANQRKTEETIAKARRATLLEVREAWANANNTIEFVEWLADELQKTGVSQ